MSIKQTKTTPQDTLEFKLTKSMDTFSIKTPIELEEGKRMIAITCLEAHPAVFIFTKHYKRFTFYTPGFWEGPEKNKRSDKLIERKKLNQVNYM